jgi:multiple sugar transport system substrate-binding protein
MVGAAACSSGFGGGGGGGGSSSSLNVAWWGNASRAALYRKALALFTKQHPGVTTQSQYADLDPYLQRLATEAAAGSLPDVLWMRDTHIGRYGSSGDLLNLKKYIGHGVEVMDLGPTAVSDGQVGNGVFALPTHYVGQAVITNTRVFSKLGISYPQTATWDQIGAIATHISKESGKGFWGCNDPTLGSTQRHFQAYVRQTGGELFSSTGGLGFGADVLGEWLNYWQKLRKAGAIPPAGTELQSETCDDQNLLVTNKAGFLWESSNHLASWQDLTKDPLAMYSLPTLPNASKTWWFFPPILLSVSAKTKAPKDCVALVDFFLNNKAAAKITQVDQGAPSSSAIRKYLLPTLSKPEATFVQQIDREMSYPRRPQPVQPKGAEKVNDAIARTSQQVAYGRQSVSAAATAFMGDAKQALGA